MLHVTIFKMIENSNVAILEVRAGTGGLEAKIWAQELLRMYLKFGQKKGFKVNQVDENSLRISGFGAYNRLKNETGVHRVQRIPLTEKRGRIHTSTAVVTVMPEISENQIKIDPKDLEFQFFRSSTQGGQNVQKVESAVRIIHKPTGITVSSQQERYQERNKQLALSLLRSKLWQLEMEKKESLVSEFQAKAGVGKRSEKIRTYNFPQDRITDHRTKKNIKGIKNVLSGNLEKIIPSSSLD